MYIKSQLGSIGGWFSVESERRNYKVLELVLGRVREKKL